MENPAEGMNIVCASNQSESYDPFDRNEIARIFQAEQYLKQLRMPGWRSSAVMTWRLPWVLRLRGRSLSQSGTSSMRTPPL